MSINKIEDPKIDELLVEWGRNRSQLYLDIKEVDEILKLVKESFPKNPKYGKSYQYVEHVKAVAELFSVALRYKSELTKIIGNEINVRMKLGGSEDGDKVEDLKKLSKELLKQAMDLKVPVSIGENYYDEDKEIKKAHSSKKGILG